MYFLWWFFVCKHYLAMSESYVVILYEHLVIHSLLLQETDDKVILSLHHLQSAFFVLLLGFKCALLAFIGENVFVFCIQKN